MNKDLLNKFEDLKGKGAGAFNDIPEQYFETLSERIHENIQKSNTARKKRFTYLAVAASAIVLMSLSIILSQLSNDTGKTPLAENNPAALILGDSAKSPSKEKPTIAADSIKKFYYEEVDFDRLFDEVPLEAIIEYLNEIEDFEF